LYTMTGLDRLIGFDPQLLHDSILTGINIFILFFLLSYLLFNPVRDVLEKRKQKIAQELAAAAGDMASASALKEEYEAKLKNVNKEAEDILEAARKKAKTRENEIIDEARAEASRIVERANREIELEKKKAIDDLKQDVVNIASLMAQKAVGNSIDIVIQNALIDETLKEMGESTWQS
jgi:F-type H+-transporting ATPase subunit b